MKKPKLASLATLLVLLFQVFLETFYFKKEKKNQNQNKKNPPQTQTHDLLVPCSVTIKARTIYGHSPVS